MQGISYLIGSSSVLTGNERGDIVHRTRTVESIHGDEVLEDGRLQLTEILLHTGRLKLEGSNGLSTLIKLIGQFIIDGQRIKIDDISQWSA